MLTVRDLQQGKDFADTIGFSAYGWDLPNPKRPSDNPHHGRKRPVTPIPYRVLVPAKVRHGIEWLATRTLASDLAVLPRTLVVLASRRARLRSRRHVEALLRAAETPVDGPS